MLLSIDLNRLPRWEDALALRKRTWLMASQLELPAIAVTGTAAEVGGVMPAEQPAPLWPPTVYAIPQAQEIGFSSGEGYVVSTSTAQVEGPQPLPLAEIVIPPRLAAAAHWLSGGTTGIAPADPVSTTIGPAPAPAPASVSMVAAPARAGGLLPGSVIWKVDGTPPPPPWAGKTGASWGEVTVAGGPGDPGSGPFDPGLALNREVFPLMLERYMIRRGDPATASSSAYFGSNDGTDLTSLDGTSFGAGPASPALFLGIFPGEGGVPPGKPPGPPIVGYDEADGRAIFPDWMTQGGSAAFSLRGGFGSEFARFALRTLLVSAVADAPFESGGGGESDNLLPMFASEWVAGPHDGSSVLAQLSFLEGEGVAQSLPGSGPGGLNPLDLVPAASNADPAVLVDRGAGEDGGPWKSVVSARGVLDPEGLFLVDDLPELNALAAALLGDLLGESAVPSLSRLARVREVAELNALDESSLALAATVLTVSAEVSAEPAARGAGPVADPPQEAAQAPPPSWAGFVMGLDEAFEATRLAARNWSLPVIAELTSDPSQPGAESTDAADRAAIDEALRQLDGRGAPSSLDDELYLLLPDADDEPPRDDEQRPAAVAGAGSIALSVAPAMLAGTVAPPVRRRRERLRNPRRDSNDERGGDCEGDGEA